MRYSTVNFFQGILYFLVIFLLSFLRQVKGAFHFLLHSKQGHGFTPIYPSLRTESTPSSCTYDCDQDTLAEPHKKKDHPCETHGTIVDISADIVHLSDQERSLITSELASVNSTIKEQSAAMTLSPTTSELRKPSSFGFTVVHGSAITPAKAKLFSPILLPAVLHDLPKGYALIL